MKTSTTGTVIGGPVEVRATERDSFTEYHLTGRVGESGGAADPVGELFADVAAILAEHGIQPIQEKLYGRTSARIEVLNRRDRAWRGHRLDPCLPFTWVEGAPVRGGAFAGLQLWGVVPHVEGNAVSTFVDRVTGTGRIWTGSGFRMTYFPCVCGTDPDGGFPAGSARQAERMFANADAGLKARGLSFRNVVRTWIYLARLLDGYGDLNRARTAFFRREGLDAEKGSVFPASTGIQGRSLDEECFMDVLTLETTGPGAMTATPVRRSPRQDSSFQYGSAFSRGMTLAVEGKRTVHVSGTASINRAGATVHVGDAEGQCVETLLSIAAILEEQGGSLENLTMATLFCKNADVLDAWERVTRLLHVPPIPTIQVRADVCRPDLLVEMEAVAAI